MFIKKFNREYHIYHKYNEVSMNNETVLRNDTVSKLKVLLGSLNSIHSNIDMYSLCIKKTLEEKLKNN